MIRAAATGVINFKDARLFDRAWWRRLHWLLSEVETTSCQKLVELKFLQHASALNYEAGKESFDHHWKQLNELYNKWLIVVMPWMKAQAGNHSNEKLFESWKQMFGDPSQPEVAARIQRAISDLMASVPGPNVEHTGMFGRGDQQCSQGNSMDPVSQMRGFSKR